MKELALIFLTISPLLCGMVYIISGEPNSGEKAFYRMSETLHQSSHSWPEVGICRGKRCSVLSCAMECVQREKCTVFSHNPLNNTCIMSRRPDDDPINNATADSNWNTYYRRCPTEKGYVKYTGHYPPLCLRLDHGPVLHAKAESTCLAEGANLVRIKSLAVYNIVKSILNKAKYTYNLGVYIGANDLEQERKFLWNDGTPLLQGTELWETSSEGYNVNEDCAAVSNTWKIWDSTCFDHPRGFVCQYDL